MATLIGDMRALFSYLMDPASDTPAVVDASRLELSAKVFGSQEPPFLHFLYKRYAIISSPPTWSWIARNRLTLASALNFIWLLGRYPNFIEPPPLLFATNEDLIPPFWHSLGGIGLRFGIIKFVITTRKAARSGLTSSFVTTVLMLLEAGRGTEGNVNIGRVCKLSRWRKIARKVTSENTGNED